MNLRPATLALPLLLAACALPPRSAPADGGCAEQVAQADLNRCFAQAARDAETRLQAVLARLRSRTPEERLPDLARTQEAWLRYRDLQCRHEADSYAGGTLRASVHAACLEALTEQRIRRLELVLEAGSR